MLDMARRGWVVGGVVSLIALFIYLLTMAPGLTWANHSADGGELIAAAVQNGVPHPPGYPLYILLLQGWLWIGELFVAGSDRMWLGNLFSGVCAALSAGMTTLVVARVIQLVAGRNEQDVDRPASSPDSALVIWGWAALVGLIWACSALFWGQALITEVYALHLLLTVLLAWLLFRQRVHPLFLALVVAFGVAHHLTFVLILPAALYWLIFAQDSRIAFDSTQPNNQSSFVDRSWRSVLTLGCGVLLGLLFYLRIPIAARGAPPINWGYPDSWVGFMWLVRADAYRPYLFGLPSESILERVSAWAYLTTAQYTPLGLAFALLGLAFLDQRWKQLRTFTLLWGIPISIYAIGYHTRDSEIYLLPFFWIVSLWLGVGLWFAATFVNAWLAARSHFLARGDFRGRQFWPHLAALLLVAIWIGFNWSATSLRGDQEAELFLAEARALIEADSIIYSSADAETFALWYGVWGLDEPWPQQEADELVLLNPVLDEPVLDKPVLINSSLLQFEWYRRLVAERYVDIAGIDQLSLENPVSAPLIDNIGNRPIYFSEEPSYIAAENLEVVGRFWRYTTQNQ